MKIRFLISLITLIAFTFFSSSFSLDKNPKHPYGKKFKYPKNFAYIPSGKLLMKNKKRIPVKEFFMSKFEVSNQEYNEFLADLKQQSNDEAYELAKRKPEYWYSEPFVNTYDKHPSYAEYPVLTISKEGAELYCKWLTKKWKDKNKNHQINFRLPLEYEWVYAARGGKDLAPYPWGGYYLQNKKGQYLANFKKLGASNIHFNAQTKLYEVIETKYDFHNNPMMPAPVKSFCKNDFGLYHMSGNAAEMIAGKQLFGKGNRTKGGSYNSTGYDIQIEAPDEFAGWTEPSKYIGFRPVMEVYSN